MKWSGTLMKRSQKSSILFDARLIKRLGGWRRSLRAAFRVS